MRKRWCGVCLFASACLFSDDVTEARFPGVTSTTADRKFLPNTNIPNGILRSIHAFNQRGRVSSHTEEVAVKKRKILPRIPRPSNEQVKKKLVDVGFYYGFTPELMKKTSSTTGSTKKRLRTRDTMAETLDELKRMRYEMETLRRELQIMKRRLLGEEIEDDEERQKVELLARQKKIREFERISKDVETWAHDILFRETEEQDDWKEVRCNQVLRQSIDPDDKTKAFIKWMKDSRGKKARKDDEREYPCLKFYSTIDATVEEVCSYLSQEARMPDYNDLVAIHKDLDELTPSAKICATQTPQILFIKPRTMITYCSHRWLRDGTQVVVNQACDFEEMKADAFALRGATFVAQDPDDPARTRVSIVAHASPGSDVPNWACRTAVNALAPIEPFKFFYHISKGIEKCRDELKPDLHDTELVGMPGRISRPAGLGQIGWAAFWPNGGGTKEGFHSNCSAAVSADFSDPSVEDRPFDGHE